MTTSIMVGPLLQTFFAEHLQAQQRVSQQTVASYRDSFRLLLRWIEREAGIAPAALKMSHLDAPRILNFLATLEKGRKNAVVTRNLRLTAIRSFYRFAALRDPEIAGLATRVLAIPTKRTDTKARDYITREEFDALLGTFDRRQWLGRRNYALVLTMYNTGARVSEMTTLRHDQLTLTGNGQVQLHGKGRKERRVPIWSRTSQILKAWLPETTLTGGTVAFPTRRGEPLTRFAIHLLLRKAAEQAAEICPTLKKKSVSPHQLRHGTAMALLESGVDLAVIALWLGHESIETTNVYLHSSLAMKERALGKLAPAGKAFSRFKADDQLISFLNAL
ncbi:MAG TPA: tyrosine-type recombinase/integrase [Bryobacteraceae bacterium]|jgi:site-specific recombinase XerD